MTRKRLAGAFAAALALPLLAVIPASWPGKGQLLYLGFLWWMVIGCLS